jgi:hypothetical protein
MTQGATSDKGLSYTLSRNRTHNTNIDTLGLDRFTDSESIDDSTKHSHMVSCRTVKSSCLKLDTTKDISSTNNDDDLESFILYQVDNLLGKEGEELGIYTISLISLESFTREFEKDTPWGVIFFHEKKVNT